MKLTQLVTTVGVVLALAGSAIAGTVIAPTPQLEETYATDLITGDLSVGYDSSYIFRGVTQGEDAIWSGVDLTAPLISNININAGAWYVNSTRHGGDELDLYVNLGTSLGPVDIGVGYVRYFYPTSDAEQSGEIVAALGTSLGLLDLGVLYAYDHDLETHYFEGQAGIEVALNNTIAADVDVAVGFNEDVYSYTSLRLALPVTLTDTVTFTPYVAGIIRDGSVHPGEDEEEVIGGASLSVSF